MAITNRDRCGNVSPWAVTGRPDDGAEHGRDCGAAQQPDHSQAGKRAETGDSAPAAHACVSTKAAGAKFVGDHFGARLRCLDRKLQLRFPLLQGEAEERAALPLGPDDLLQLRPHMRFGPEKRGVWRPPFSRATSAARPTTAAAARRASSPAPIERAGNRFFGHGSVLRVGCAASVDEVEVQVKEELMTEAERIGEVAERAGVSVSAILFPTSEGLIPRPRGSAASAASTRGPCNDSGSSTSRTGRVPLDEVRTLLTATDRGAPAH